MMKREATLTAGAGMSMTGLKLVCRSHKLDKGQPPENARMKKRRITTPLAAGVAVAFLAGCAAQDEPSFAEDVKPVLDQYCLSCHVPGGEGYEASGLSMVSYEALMQGATNGPMVVAGDSLGSNLVVLMEGRADPSIYMPKGSHEKVPKANIDRIKAWIDDGAKDN
jgi:hypothetical protein